MINPASGPSKNAPAAAISSDVPARRTAEQSIIFYIFSFSAKSAMASETLICCGQTASQLLQPMQALGSLSFGYEDRAIGAINPPLVKECSL